jgi:hypothetical protein
MKRWRRRASRLGVAGAVVAGGVVASVPAPAGAFCLAGTTRWDSANQTLQVAGSINGGHHIAIANSVAFWNGVSNLHYNFPNFNFTSYKDFNADALPFSFVGYPANVPGVTVNNSGATHSKSTVHLNSDFKWYTNGTMNEANRWADIGTVAGHEFGHSAGLNHPGVCGAMTAAEHAAVMHPNWTTKWAINGDDIAALNAPGRY